MKALIQLALCGVLAAGGAMAQRGGGGGGGHMGGGGGGGFHGSMGGGGGGFRGGGGGFSGGGFHGGGFSGGFNTFHGNSVFVGNGFRGCCGAGFGFGFGAGWGWPYYYGGGYYGGYGGYYPGYYDNSSYYPDYNSYPAYQTQPNVTVVYPQTQPAYVERATPVIHEYDQYGQPTGGQYAQPAVNGSGGSSSPIYLIATKDGTIHAAISYSLNGTSLSYTTIDRQQKMVSLDLVDRDLSDRLNRERHVSFNLPARQ